MFQDTFVDVILPLAVAQRFTYSIPDDLVQQVRQGVRVVVPFGKKRLYSAIVYQVHANKPQGFDIKSVIQVIDDDGPIVLPTQLRLWDWIAGYYMCSLGEVMKAALPSALKLESETYVDKTDNEELIYSEAEQQVMFLLDGKNKITIDQIIAKSGVKNPMSVIKSLIAKDAINVSEKLFEEYQPKFEAVLSLSKKYRTSEAINQLLNSLKRAQSQEKLLLGLLAFSKSDNDEQMFQVEVTKRELLSQVDVSSAVVKAMVQKGILEQQMVEVSRIKTFSNQEKEPAKLNEHQQAALESIRQNFENGKVTLLHGVTSSGKTEIYIHLIKQTVDAGKQALYLLPEIALTTQIISRLRNIFGDRVGVYHSKYGDAQRVEVYNGVLNYDVVSNLAQFDVILGVRSSVFLPFRNLGLVIVDEEHENTFKQNNPTPRYNARDVAIVLANIHGANVLLGTATPSIESYHNAKMGKYALVELTERFRNMELPQVRVVDLKKANRDRKLHTHFSSDLLDEIGATLERNEQVILFQNRRGYAPVVECADCGWVPRCEHCDVSLTYHKNTNMLVCHYCGFSLNNPSACPSCEGKNLKMKGFGTEKIEDDLALYFPKARIKRLDLDSTRSKSSYERIIDDFENGEVDILVGTQMITKGLDFDKVSLVGILNADSMLNFPDFRAFEHSYQLMSQVAGRAGRKGRRGLVILQTSQPEHSIVREVVSQDYVLMYEEQIEERRLFNFPPFCRLINISLRHRDNIVLAEHAKVVAAALRKTLGNCVLGPEAPVVARVQNLYIMEIMVKVDPQKSLMQVKEVVDYYLKAIRTQKTSLSVAIDVDPM